MCGESKLIYPENEKNNSQSPANKNILFKIKLEPLNITKIDASKKEITQTYKSSPKCRDLNTISLKTKPTAKNIEVDYFIVINILL